MSDVLGVGKPNVFKSFKAAPQNLVSRTVQQGNQTTQVVSNEPSKSDMRLVDWERGTPYTWQTSDYKELVKSDKFFARKFSSADIKIVYAIYRHVMEEKFNDKKQ